MSARITVASTNARIDELVGVVTGLVELVTAQFATPAAVAEVVTTPKARKSAKATTATKTALVSVPTGKAAKPAKHVSEADKARKAAEWAAVKDARVALSPVNKALVKVLGTATGADWDARWTNVDALNQALASLPSEVAQAALPHVQAKVTKAAQA